MTRRRLDSLLGRLRLTASGPWRHPVRWTLVGLVLTIAAGTLVLLLPAASTGPGGAGFRVALLTATSAACAAGITLVDTGSYWSGLGQGVILALVEIGGLGLMISASLLGLLAATRLGLHTRLTRESPDGAVDLTTVRRVVTGSAGIAFAVQGALLVVLTLRLWLGHGYGFGRALYTGLFDAVSAFCSAGFSLAHDSMAPFAGDPLVLVPVALAVLAGGLGYPVLLEALQVRPVQRWSVHTRLTLVVTAVLLVVGPLAVVIGEWHNPGTLGALDPGARALSGAFDGVVGRTTAFHTFDYANADSSTLLVMDLLMLIGGASGSTAGGIKLTTVGVLVLAVLAEVRGHADIDAFDRRMAAGTIRQAVAVCGVAVAVVVFVTLTLLEVTGESLDRVLFDVSSAFGTAGLTTGVIDGLRPASQLLLGAVIVVGRIGPIAVATALALRPTRHGFRNPEARPIIG